MKIKINLVILNTAGIRLTSDMLKTGLTIELDNLKGKNIREEIATALEKIGIKYKAKNLEIYKHNEEIYVCIIYLRLFGDKTDDKYKETLDYVNFRVLKKIIQNMNNTESEYLALVMQYAILPRVY